MQDQEEITLKELIQKANVWFRYIRKRWLFVLIAAAIGASVGLYLAYKDKPVYTATLSFALEEEKSGSLGGAIGLASQLGIDFGGSAGGAFSSANLVELMKSRMLVEKALLNTVFFEGKKMTLADAYIIIYDWRQAWNENPYLTNVSFPVEADRSRFTLLQDSVMGVIYRNILSENLSVGLKDKKTSINVIDVKSRNELFSKYFAERLAVEMSEYYVETKTKKSMQNVGILQKQVDSVRGELNAALTGAAVLNDNIYSLNPAMSSKRVSPSKKQIDVQANTAILTQLVQNLEIAKMALMRETPLMQVIDTPVLPLKKEKASKRNGVLYGGFIGGFISIIILVLLRMWQKMRVQTRKQL